MRIEIGEQKPEQYKEYWPGQYHYFSHFEYVSGVPHALFLITTLKDNGKPNACFHSWSAFSGDSGGFFAVLTGIGKGCHTYKNILREKEFCINFLTPNYYDACIKTIKENADDTDELMAAGFTSEPSRLIKPPRIKEAFLSYECILESITDLSGKDISVMIIGRVKLAAADGKHTLAESLLGENGFMFNVHSPKDPITGEGEKSVVASLKLEKYD